MMLTKTLASVLTVDSEDEQWEMEDEREETEDEHEDMDNQDYMQGILVGVPSASAFIIVEWA